MTLEERISKLHALSKYYEELASIVRRMEANEDNPVFDTEWDKELKDAFETIFKHSESHRKDLRL